MAHQILLKRLDCMSIRGTPNILIKSYLERKQSTKIANEVGEEVEFAVPQGTVLSTLLFNVYIDSLMSILTENSVVFCFADDFNILIWVTAKDQTEKAIQKIKHWLDNSLLSINVNKTKN